MDAFFRSLCCLCTALYSSPSQEEIKHNR
jgi:hypothetical protein